MKRIRTLTFPLLGAGLLLTFPFWFQEVLRLHYGARITALADAPPAPVALVFGARVYDSGRLSSMLRDRMDVAIELLEAEKVEALLLSGGTVGGLSESEAMRQYALQRGVAEAAILVDTRGNRTYDSCYRAGAVFGVRQAILVSQGFHLPRALFTCDALGMEATAVAADLRRYSPRALQWSESRELPASLRALYDVVLRRAPDAPEL